MFWNNLKMVLPNISEALPGREVAFIPQEAHPVSGNPVFAEAPAQHQIAIFGLGCFWGAEEIFWQLPGVWSTSVGYSGGHTPNPTYEEVCSGRTGHTEAVRIIFNPEITSYATLVKKFYEIHDPTQVMRQGNDIGTQYRSAIYYLDENQAAVANQLTAEFQAELSKRKLGNIVTEIAPAQAYYYAEDYHQQYLFKNPTGYRCHANTGVKFPTAG